MKKNKITLDEFWSSRKNLAIHCSTEQKANKLLKAFDKYGEIWRSEYSYLEINYWNKYEEKTCYCNNNGFCCIDWYKENDYKIYEFDEVDLNN